MLIIDLKVTQDYDWILTAAHCCEGMAEHTLFIGDHQNGIFNETGTEKIMIADSVAIHPERANVKEYHNNFDACLLRPIGIGTAPGVAAVCLPTQSPKHGEACWVAGWGTTSIYKWFEFCQIIETNAYQAS